MRRFGYSQGLATGCIASAGVIGILIPPSTIFIVYGILTEQSIGSLFAAGIGGSASGTAGSGPHADTLPVACGADDANGIVINGAVDL